ncbi:MAG: DUF993 family protein, partial [Pirellula sp.]|nr:DUF993 family protein [Pirellula sp.]
AAAYLPWKPVGMLDFDSYARVLESIWGCGLIPAVNMDTGFVNLLTESQRLEVLHFASSLAQGRELVAGAYVGDLAGDCQAHYKAQFETIATAGAVPIVFQCTDLVRRPNPDILNVYRELGKLEIDYLAFELGAMFADFGAIYSMDLFAEIMEIPSLIGIKHSSLRRELEWQRLAIRDERRPDFKIYTGNDLAIDMIQWGSDYLLGLAAFFPEAFARRDRLWASSDRRFYELNDALQLLGGFAFRDPVPAYKHNAAMTLMLRGMIASDALPMHAPSRPSTDREFLAMVIDRIQMLVTD